MKPRIVKKIHMLELVHTFLTHVWLLRLRVLRFIRVVRVFPSMCISGNKYVFLFLLDNGALVKKTYSNTNSCTGGSTTDTSDMNCLYYRWAGCSNDTTLGPYSEYGNNFVTKT
jgi:hypothetical protein